MNTSDKPKERSTNYIIIMMIVLTFTNIVIQIFVNWNSNNDIHNELIVNRKEILRNRDSVGSNKEAITKLSKDLIQIDSMVRKETSKK